MQTMNTIYTDQTVLTKISSNLPFIIFHGKLALLLTSCLLATRICSQPATCVKFVYSRLFPCYTAKMAAGGGRLMSFVTEKEAEEIKRRKQEQWEKVRKPGDPLGTAVDNFI